MIDVIIPCYNSHNTIKDTLYSILYQINLNELNVYLIDDCSEKDYSEEVEEFSKYFRIKQIRLDHNSGPGVARRVGLENSNSPYVTFIDSDDSFSSPISLFLLKSAIEENDDDVVISKTYEESGNNILEKGHNTIWVHGKLYRRKFLEDNNITFNDSRANEDNGFNQLIVLCKAKLKYIDHFTYCWRYNTDSITRINDHDYSYKGLIGYAYNMFWALDNAKNHDYNKIKHAELSYAVVMALYYYYIIYIDRDDVDELVNYAKKIYNLYKLNPISDERKQSITESQFDNVYKDKKNRKNVLNPCVNISEFINRLESN